MIFVLTFLFFLSEDSFQAHAKSVGGRCIFPGDGNVKREIQLPVFLRRQVTYGKSQEQIKQVAGTDHHLFVHLGGLPKGVLQGPTNPYVLEIPNKPPVYAKTVSQFLIHRYPILVFVAPLKLIS